MQSPIHRKMRILKNPLLGNAKKGLIFPGNRDTLTAYVRRDGLPALEKIYGWQYVAASFSCARCAMIDSHVQSILSLSRDFGRLL